jgi:hypothetical protein
MNKETLLINNYIQNRVGYIDKVSQLRKKHNNIKDFQVMFGYLVMDIVNNEKSFINLKRSEIDLPSLAAKFFEAF